MHRPPPTPRRSFAPIVVGVLSSAAMLWAAPAQAALWGYVDGAGVAHVATAQLDSHYRLVLGDTDPNTSRVPGKSDRTASLMTWPDIAPAVRALQPMLREAARDAGVDVELLQAIIVVESGYNGRAVSPRGALGLMQITPDAADRYSSPAERARPPAERLLDPRHNVRTGARMLADLTRRFRRIDLALAAWNAGEGKVRLAGGEMPAIAETRAHVQLVLELYWSLLQNTQARLATQLKIHPT